MSRVCNHGLYDILNQVEMVDKKNYLRIVIYFQASKEGDDEPLSKVH